jgi:YidC/Oxa1 family membrane protein insertase
MDTKTLLAIVLSIAVLIGYQYFVSTQPQVVPPKTSAPKTEEAAKTAPSPVVAEPAPIVPSSEEKEIRVENDLYRAVFTSRGGTVKYWEIKPYKDKQGRDIVLLGKPGVLPALGIGSGSSFDLSRVNFSVSGDDLRLDGNNKSGSIVFAYSKDGISARRTYTFYADTYAVDITDEVSGGPEYWITLGSDFGIFDKEASYAHVGPVLLKGTDLDELKAKKLLQPQIFQGDLKWIGQEDKYFCSALVPSTQVEQVKAWTDKDSPVIAFRGKPGVNKFRMYAGPKEHDRLARLGNGLEYIIDYGFFSVIARPLFWILKFFYNFIGNYGWAIIVLTIVVRIPFIPLVSKGQRSMKKLQQIQPKMNEIKEKYKNDPKRMQQEMMELYKKYKVNPMGGCLPMILQIPVFFALYKVLLVSIELRNAPFMLWITDLSSKDPYYILPIVMGITMVVQQKMTPSSMDPKQAKIMMFMPVVFTFMFLNFASGLVLYWLVNNLLSIVQQFYINSKVEKQPA